MSLEQQKPLRELRRSLVSHFNLDQLQTLAIDLGLDWAALPGNQISTKAQSLVRAVAGDGRLPELLALLQEERPDVSWPELPPSEDQATQSTALSENEQIEALQQYKANLTARLEMLEDSQKPTIPDLQSVVLHETTKILRKLDGVHKGSVLRFLHDSHLLAGTGDMLAVDQIDLGGIVLTKAILAGVDLSRAFLRDADLSHCDLRWANLGGADLSRANLSHANLMEARLWGANLHRANLRSTNLRGARLSGAILHQADLRRADLDQVYFWDADLSDANLFQAKNVTDQQLSYARTLQGAKLPDGRLYRQ